MTSHLNDAFTHLPVTPVMPAIFIGHGNPMNAIVDNAFCRQWQTLGKTLARPQAILCVSAHWMSARQTLVHVGNMPRTIHDFGGFPAALFAQRYPAPGAPELANALIEQVTVGGGIAADQDWGLDHGAWSVLMHLFPEADVPVFQLSLVQNKSPREHFAIGAALSALRERGVLILGSGNLVHNLRMIAPDRMPYDWALEFDDYLARAIENRDVESILKVEDLGHLMQMAHPTIEHFLPMLFPLAVARPQDKLEFFNVGFDLASISMRSFMLSGA